MNKIISILLALLFPFVVMGAGLTVSTTGGIATNITIYSGTVSATVNGTNTTALAALPSTNSLVSSNNAAAIVKILVPTTNYISSTNGVGTTPTLNGPVTIVGNGGSGNMTIGGFTSVGISPYFGTLRINADAGGLYVIDPNNQFEFTSGWNDNPGGGNEKIGFRQYFKKNQLDLNGASVTAVIPSVGGGVAGAAGLTPWGNAIWANQRLPYVVLSSRAGGVSSGGTNNANFCTQTFMSNAVASFVNNNYVTTLTNLGVICLYNLENGWLTNHRDSSGLLAWNTNRFPMQTASQTNVANFLHTNGLEAGLESYIDTVGPTNNDTEVSVGLNGGPPYWYYPSQSDQFGGAENQVLITPSSILNDISTDYAWGFDMHTFQDSGNYVWMGNQLQLERLVAEAVLYPRKLSVANSPPRNWNSWYTNTFNSHGLIVNYLRGEAAISWPMSDEPAVNGLALESGTFPNEPANSGIPGNIIQALRQNLRSTTNFLDRTVHPIWQTDTLVDQQLWDAGNWQFYLGACAMFNSHVWLCFPQVTYLPTSAFGNNMTNVDFVSLWQDKAQRRPVYTSIGASNGIVAVKLYSQSSSGMDKYKVWFENERTTSTNLTITFTNLGFDSGAVCSVRDVWSSTELGLFTSSYTSTVGATNANLLIFTFVPSLTNTLVSSTVASGSAQQLLTGFGSNVTSIAISPGVWDITGVVDYTFGAATSFTYVQQGISLVSQSQTLIQDQYSLFETAATVPTAIADPAWVIPTVRITNTLTVATNVYLNAKGVFTIGTLKAYGTIRAERKQ